LKFDKGVNVKSVTPRASSYTTIAFGMTSNIFKPAVVTPRNNEGKGREDSFVFPGIASNNVDLNDDEMFGGFGPQQNNSLITS
jgi:hypothetical protein